MTKPALPDNEDERLADLHRYRIATFDAGEDAASLSTRADEALYAAKRGGRNRVVVADAATAAMPMRRAPR